MAYTQEFKEKVTYDLKEIGGSLDRFKSIGTRLDRIAEYTDPNNPEGLGKATDLLYEHVRNQDAVGEITGFTSSMKNFTVFLKVMANIDRNNGDVWYRVLYFYGRTSYES